jgi:hypothetical protein
MQSAITLVHKGAMTIAAHSIHSFARHFGKTHRLQIHSDGSLDAWDIEILLKSALGMEVEIVSAEQRQAIVAERLKDYPYTQKLLAKGGYFTKLELPVFYDEPYFYFDSDVIWLKPVINLAPVGRDSAFSTEGWSWYFGICRDARWIEEKTPRRVNSGIYHLSSPFPFERMEKLLENQMFDWTIPGNSDQEIMAYLYPGMTTYHQEDIKRSRVGKNYDLSTISAAALHFPGRMWKTHMDQIERLPLMASSAATEVRFEDAVELTHLELFKMRTYMSLANTTIARGPIRMLRKIRKCLVPG